MTITCHNSQLATTPTPECSDEAAICLLIGPHHTSCLGKPGKKVLLGPPWGCLPLCKYITRGPRQLQFSITATCARHCSEVTAIVTISPSICPPIHSHACNIPGPFRVPLCHSSTACPLPRLMINPLNGSTAAASPARKADVAASLRTMLNT